MTTEPIPTPRTDAAYALWVEHGGTHFIRDESKKLERECHNLRAELNEANNELMRIQANDQFDSAYWRGHDDACRGVARKWDEALHSPYPKPGVMQDLLEKPYRETEQLRAELTLAQREIEQCREVLEGAKNVLEILMRSSKGGVYGYVQAGDGHMVDVLHLAATIHETLSTLAASGEQGAADK